MLSVTSIPVLTDNYVHVIHNEATGETAVVDPSVSKPVIAFLEGKNWRLDWILNTHHHTDHTGGNEEIKKVMGAKVIGYGPDAYRIPAIDIQVHEGEEIILCGKKAIVLFIPGHTLGHIAYYFPDEKMVFPGDTLFLMGCGRLFEGTAQQMVASLQQLKKLPAETRIYCGHEYTEKNGQFALTVEPENTVLCQRMEKVRKLRQHKAITLPGTIGEELLTNPFFRAHSKEIRQRLNMEEASEEDVFAELRKRKDHF